MLKTLSAFVQASRAGLLALALGVTSVFAAAAPEVTLHVSTQGSDLWSGGLPAPNGDGTDGPFATLTRARDAVRALKQAQGGSLKQPVIVYVRGGRYELSEPLRFGPEDSATEDDPVTYAAFPGEEPVLSGGRVIGGWREVTVNGRNLWAADVPGAREGRWIFHELWIDGRRRALARSPATGFYRIANVPGFDSRSPYQIGQLQFQFNPGDIRLYQNPEDVDLVLLMFWVSERRGIASLDQTRHLVTLTQRSTMRLTDGFGRTPHWARYYVENAIELLDSPGEWYLNRRTGVLYYMPFAGERLDRIEAIAPVLPQIMVLEGDPQRDRLVERLSFRGLSFEHSEWWPPAHPDRRTQLGNEGQAAVGVPGTIQLTGARHCALEDCSIAHVGGFGMNYGRRDTIRNNIFAFGELSQIEPLGGMAKAPQGNSYVLEQNRRPKGARRNKI